MNDLPTEESSMNTILKESSCTRLVPLGLDETWVYLNDTNKSHAIYYRPLDEKGCSNFFLENKEKFAKEFMVVTG